MGNNISKHALLFQSGKASDSPGKATRSFVFEMCRREWYNELYPVALMVQ